MSAAKEMSLMLQDVVEVEESGGLRTGTRTNTGWVRGFSDSHVRDRAGDASEIEIVVTDGPDSELTVTYALKSRFPVRIDDYARLVARVPKEAELMTGMGNVRITRLTRALKQK